MIENLENINMFNNKKYVLVSLFILFIWVLIEIIRYELS